MVQMDLKIQGSSRSPQGLGLGVLPCATAITAVYSSSASGWWPPLQSSCALSTASVPAISGTESWA
jgi:hypothetical protein